MPQKNKKSVCTYSPEFDKILDDCGTDDYTVQWSVSQEQNKVFVVWESNTVIDPERSTAKTGNEHSTYTH